MAKVRYGERVANQVTAEQLQAAWSAGVAAVEKSLKREQKLVEQEQWLQRNTSHPDYLSYLSRVTVNRDVWYVEYLDPMYQAAAAFDRAVQRAGPEMETAVRDIHPYAVHGAQGLHELHRDRAVELGLPSSATDTYSEADLPF